MVTSWRSGASSGPTSGGLSRRAVLGRGTAAALGVAAAGAGLSGCANFTSSRPGPKDFVFTFWGSPIEKEIVSLVIDDFCAEQGLVGRPAHVPGVYNTKINTLIASDTPPDAGYLGAGTAMMFAEEGLVSDVAGLDGFDDVLPQAVHYYNDTEAITNSCLEATALWFDRKATDKAGVRPPQRPDEAWSWDELVQNATKLTRDGEGRTPAESGFEPATVQQYGMAAPTALLALQGFFLSNGTPMFSADGRRCNLDRPEAVEVVQAVNDLIFEHRVAPTPAQAATFGSNTGLLLQSGRVAMIIDGQWSLLDIAATDLDYDVGVLPGFGGDYTTMVTSGASVIFRASKHVEAASELILRQMADPRVVSLYRAGLWMPMRRQFYDSEDGINAWLNPKVHPPGYRTAVLEPTFRQATSEPGYQIRNSDVIFGRLNSAVAGMFTTRQDVRAACQATATKINALMRGSYPDVKA